MCGQFLVIFALMLTGYFFRKIKVISEEMNRGLNKFIIYFSFPCFIFHKVAKLEINSGFLTEFLMAVILSLTLFLFISLYAYGYAKIRAFPGEDAGSAEIMMIFPNNAFMGFPIAYIFFGDMGLLFMLANNLAMNLMLFSYGFLLLRRGDKNKGINPGSMAKCFLNPNILALIAGLFFYFLKIPVPEAVSAYLSYVGGICTPMAMIFVGSTLVGTNIVEVVKDRIVLESVINKNLLIPGLAFLTMMYLPLPDMVIAVTVFAMFFPSAAVASVLVEAEGRNSGMACGILVVTTAISIITIPAAARLINLFIL